MICSVWGTITPLDSFLIFTPIGLVNLLTDLLCLLELAWTSSERPVSTRFLKTIWNRPKSREGGIRLVSGVGMLQGTGKSNCVSAKDTESHKDKRRPEKIKRSKFRTSNKRYFPIQHSLNLQNLGGLCLSMNMQDDSFHPNIINTIEYFYSTDNMPYRQY